MLDFLTDSDDVIAKELRKRYVFKMIPMLNPDGNTPMHSLTETHAHTHTQAHLTLFKAVRIGFFLKEL